MFGTRFFAIYVSTGLIIACSGRSGPDVTGRQCPRNYDPIQMDIPESDASHKIEWSKAGDALPAGDYEEITASLYYVDNLGAPNDNLRIYIVDVKQKDGTFKATTSGNGCVRNAPRDLRKPIVFSTEGVTGLTVSQNKAATVSETREFGFQLTAEGNLKLDFQKAIEKPGTDPGSVFTGKVLESFVYKRSETEYEIRSKGVVDTPEQSGTFHLSVVLRSKSAR